MTITSRIRSLGLPSLVASVLLLPLAASAQTTPPPSEPPPVSPPPPVVVEPAPAQPVVVVTPPAEPAKPPPPPPEPVTTANKGKVTIKGFVSASMFVQDTPFLFGDGQNAEFPVPTRDKGDDPLFIDGDVRNTRLNLTWDSPTGTSFPKMSAQLEVDFFAGTFGGGFGNAQAVPRIRLASIDVALGPGTFRIGQSWAPYFGLVPVSVSRLAFPLGYGSAGAGGWRFAGLWYVLPLTPKDAPLGASLTLAVMRNSWGPAASIGLNPPNQGNTGLPQLEGRIDLNGKAGKNAWSAYVTGHFDQKDLDARGEAMGDDASLTAYGVKGGAKIQAGPLLVQAEGHFSKAMGHQFDHLFQIGDIAGVGFWGQLGFDVTPAIGIFGFFGMELPNEDDVLAAIPIAPAGTMPPQAAGTLPRLKNMQAAGMVRWKAGSYQLGLEYIFDQLTFQDLMGEETVAGNQVILSGLYTF